MSTTGKWIDGVYRQSGDYGGAGDYGYYVDPTTGNQVTLNSDAYNALAATDSGLDMGTLADSSGGNDFWSMKGGGGLALGGLQTGIGLLGTLDAMKTAKLQRNLLGQQYDTNAEKMANWRNNTANVKSAFNSGLAASGVPS